MNATYEGLIYKFNRKYITRDMSTLSERTRQKKETSRRPRGSLPIVHARVNNLKDVSVNIPIGVLTVVTGVAGSGKSSLIHEVFLSQHQGAIVIDQSPVGISSRSNPATYTDLAFLEGVKLPCDVCEGKRFKSEVLAYILAYTLHGKSIADVLAMTVE